MCSSRISWQTRHMEGDGAAVNSKLVKANTANPIRMAQVTYLRGPSCLCQNEGKGGFSGTLSTLISPVLDSINLVGDGFGHRQRHILKNIWDRGDGLGEAAVDHNGVPALGPTDHIRAAVGGQT